jgi:hypothetical protein
VTGRSGTAAIAEATGVAGQAAASPRRILLASYAAFTLVGWTSLLVPTLIRELKADFG